MHTKLIPAAQALQVVGYKVDYDPHNPNRFTVRQGIALLSAQPGNVADLLREMEVPTDGLSVVPKPFSHNSEVKV